jgi:hypothetical protein
MTQDTPSFLIAGVTRVEDIHKQEHAVVDLMTKLQRCPTP